jgi:hypothetical protein
VENAVNILYTRVYAPLHGSVFHKLEDLNKAILELLDKHNNRAFQTRTSSRQQQFEAIEQSALSALPEHRFELKSYRSARVHPNGHVLLSEDKHHYSVPYQYIGKQVSICYNQHVVEVYYQYKQIATHCRTIAAHRYSTIESHLHPRHQYYRRWSQEYFIGEGTRIGSHTQLLMEQIFLRVKHPEQGYKLCQGVLSLAKTHGNERMEEAAGICLQYDYTSYAQLKYVLSLDFKSFRESQEEEHRQDPLSTHENLRGSAYYQ